MLVTGSKGFIGKNLSNHLGQIEQNVQLIDADYFQDEDWKRSLFNFLEKTGLRHTYIYNIRDAFG